MKKRKMFQRKIEVTALFDYDAGVDVVIGAFKGYIKHLEHNGLEENKKNRLAFDGLKPTSSLHGVLEFHTKCTELPEKYKKTMTFMTREEAQKEASEIMGSESFGIEETLRGFIYSNQYTVVVLDYYPGLGWTVTKED